MVKIISMKCPKCKVELIKHEGVSEAPNGNLFPDIWYECKDCGRTYELDFRTFPAELREEE